MSTARYIVGDVFAAARQLERGSIDVLITSPPFLRVREYLPDDHPAKALEIGRDPSPGEFIDTLLRVLDALAPALAPHASIVVELGDTYAGAGSRMKGSRDGARSSDDGYRSPTHRTLPGWPKDKSKCMIPYAFALALAYGFNPLTGTECEQWRVRNVVAWCRRNPPVGADSDKFRPAHSLLTIATKARDRYWDGDAVRDGNYQPRAAIGKLDSRDLARKEVGLSSGNPGRDNNPAGAPLLDWWDIPTEPYEGSHYATWPRALVVPLVRTMCPQRVCMECGQPSTRIVEHTRTMRGTIDNATQRARSAVRTAGPFATDVEVTRRTLGWSDCGHGAWRKGVVLDPFAGTGTTLAVATGHGVEAIGIDLDERNAQLAVERIGPLLVTVEQPGCLPA